jgi:hypothetical protein
MLVRAKYQYMAKHGYESDDAMCKILCRNPEHASSNLLQNVGSSLPINVVSYLRGHESSRGNMIML